MLAKYTYSARNNFLERLDYGNGDRVEYEYDKQGRVTSQTYEDGDTVTYRYDNNGALASVTDSATGRTTTYYYDFTDRLMKYMETGDVNHTVQYTYDDKNKLTDLVEVINGVTHTTHYTYDDDQRITSIQNGSRVISYTYDAYGRVTHKTDGIFGYSYTYKNTSTGAPSNQIATVSVILNGSPCTTFQYTYDDNGNILSVNDTGMTNTYVYDSAGQLIRENNRWANKTWVWTYDDAGNILSRKEYAYTTGTLGAVQDTVTYTYGDASWGDLLTAYDGVAITYDQVGNPLSDGTWTYTWEHGRQLASMAKSGTTWRYTYDANGMRTSRSNGSTTYSYVYNGSELMQMTVGANTLTFTYDGSGNPSTVTLNGTTYYYITNLQGDVIEIRSASGTLVCYYSYDAWGNIVSTTTSSTHAIVSLNPLRYRGYVYDTDTGLYYLQSRYYNPEIGRFLNADAFVSTGQWLLGNNMFAYCNNNPVMGYDPSGHFSWKDVFKAAATVTVAAFAVVVIIGSGGTAAPPLLAAASALAGTTVTAAAATTVAAGVAITGVATMGVAVTASILESTSDKKPFSNRDDKYSGGSTYDVEKERIDYEYNGNGTGNVHYQGKKGKETIWRLQDGIAITYTVSKAVSKIISNPIIQKAIDKAIHIVSSLAGIE